MKTNKTNQEKYALGASAIAASLVFSSPLALADDEQPACKQDTEICESAKKDEALERIEVHGMRSSIYRFDKSGDPRRVADLVDTPTTITVLTQDQIQESGKTDLKEISHLFIDKK